MNCIRVIVLLTVTSLRNICGFDIIELNHDVGTHNPFLPLPANTTFKLTVQEAGYSRGFWLAYSEITTQEFLSTHVVVSYFLHENGISVDEIEFRELFATAAVIDVRDKVEKNHFYEVTVEDVKNWQQENGMFPEHCIVLFNTGWDEIGGYPDQISYYGSADDLTNLKFPGVSLDAMKYILNFEKSHGIHFVGAGIDGPDLDNGRLNKFIVDRFVIGQNKYFIANLKDLKRLPPKGAKIMVMPMKIKNSSGSPARVAAQIPGSY